MSTTSGNKLLSVFLLALPIAFFFYTIGSYSVNIPIGDDFDSILRFLNEFLSSADPLERIRLLFSQHNEHRIAFNRAVTLTAYYAFGQVDLRLLIYFGNIALIGIALLLAVSTRKDDRNLLYILPAFICLFQFHYYQAANWAMASISNFYVLLFSFLAFSLLAAKSGYLYFALSALFFALASFTQGGGLIAGIVGLLIILLKKDHRKAAIWAFISAVVFILYFYGYSKPLDHPALAVVLSKTPLLPARYFLSFLGSPFPMPELFGAASVLFFLFLTFKKYYKTNTALYSFLLFLFLVAAAASLSRSGFGIEQSLDSRYKIIPLLITSIYYLAVMELIPGRTPKKIFFGASLAVLLAFNAFSYFDNIGELKMQKSELEYGVAKWRLNGTGLIYPFDQNASAILNESINKGVYTPPSFGSLSIKAGRKEMPEPALSANITYRLENVLSGPEYIAIDGWAFLNGSGPGDVLLALKSPSGVVFLDTVTRKRPDVSEYFGKALDDSGFFCLIPRSLIGKGAFEIGIYVKNNGGEGYQLSENELLNDRDAYDASATVLTSGA